MNNNISKLPDAYNKLTGGNLYNLLQLALYTSSIAVEDFQDIDSSRDLSSAQGATLDYYGAMVGEPRNGATDTQYLTKIMNRMSLNVAGTDVNGVIKAIAQTLSVPASAISLTEGNCNVQVNGLTIAIAENSGYSVEEINAMIEGLLPIGVGLLDTIYAGTLLISDTTPTAILEDYPVLFPAWYLSQREYVLRGNDVGLKGAGTVPNAFLAVGAGVAPTDDEPWYENIGTDGMEATGTYSGGTLAILS